YIRETLDSVYQVNYHDLEVIIWDDGSTDVESLQVLTQVEKEYPGLKVYWGKNQGLAGARNSLAQVATGEFLAFLDADDKIHPDYYPKAVQILQNYDNVGMVSAWVQHFGDYHGKWIAWQTEFPYLLCHNMIGSAVVVRKSAYLQVGGQKVIMSKLGGFEDWEGYVNMNGRGWLCTVIPELYFWYRVRKGSMYRSLSLQNHNSLAQQIANLHLDLYRLYGKDVFNLCNQNWVSPIYWTNPAKDYHLLFPSHGRSSIWQVLKKLANLLGVPQSQRDKLKELFGRLGILTMYALARLPV
ncbi:MAG: glycosyltransferase family 2 protein, partial [Gloeomargarita sp. SKYG98]|nr:glycosyltransferase family 2 protein [Gloeomargarita sp. SKYG98]